MTEQDKLLNTIRKYDFAMYELNLYLDTHRKCSDALAYFRKYKELREKAVSEYTEKFGPLMADKAAEGQTWSWTNGPWPWQEV